MMPVFMPMVAVTVIMAVAYNLLVVTALVTCISGPYVAMVFPWVVLVNYHFITMVPVEVTETWW